MNYLLLITLIALSITITFAVEDWNSPQLKSFSAAQQECAVYLLLSNETVQRYADNGYPDEFHSRKLINCILYQLHAFDEVTGVRDHVISSFFLSPGGCSEHIKRTQECLNSTVPERCCEETPFERTYRTFQCYYRHYGSLLTDVVRFLPYEPARAMYRIKLVFDSLSMVNTSCKALREFSVKQGFIVENISHALYTLGLRSGFYDLEHGLYVDRLYAQFGKLSLLSETTRQCLVRVSQQYNTEPLRVTQLVLQCVEQDISTQGWLTVAAQQILASSSSYCNVCEPLPAPAISTVSPDPSEMTTAKYPYPSM
nr:uncharacterized protein LOC109414409 [Aedes albopictus]